MEIPTEHIETEVEEQRDVCPHCGADPCWKEEIKPVLLSLVEVYGGYMEP